MALFSLLTNPGMGLIMLLFTILIIYPAVRLSKYFSKIAELMHVPSQVNLAEALEQQRAFWKYVGVASIFYIVLILIFAIFFGALLSNLR